MNTNTKLSKGSRIQLNKRQPARTGILLLLLFLLTLPAVVQAEDYTYTISNGTVTITEYTGPGGAVAIPGTINGLPVTTIGGHLNIYGVWAGAFYQCTSLTSVAIPNSVTSIGEYAFYECTSLTNVTISISVTNIGFAAFAGSALTSVTIPNSLTSIADAMFEVCSSLISVTIPDSVTSIGFAAFDHCPSLTSVTIPCSVTNIGGWNFLDCASLTAITVDTNNLAYSSVDGVLFNKSQTTLIQCPGGKSGSYTIPNSVTNFDQAFRFCFYLTSVTIPSTFSEIGDWTFENCLDLTRVTIPNSVTNIGDYAFNYCTSLTNLTIPNSVTSIGEGVFSGCFNLAGVTIPDSVTSIGGSAFNGCYSLTSVTIPNGVTYIGGDAFCQCTSLTNVTIPNSVTNIGDYAFYGCTSLTGVYVEGNAPSLGGTNVFFDAANATVYYLPGTTGWRATFGGRPTALWIQVPTIQTPPRTQTAEAGSAVGLRVEASSPLPLFYLWYLNSTNLPKSSTNRELNLTNVQFAQIGAYSVVVSNVLGAVTSTPAMLNVIAPVERRPVPGVKVTGEMQSSLNVDYANSLSLAPNWTTLSSVSLTSTPQYWFDLTLPLPPQRFYRAWQTGTPGVRPSLDVHLVPALTLTGSIGHSVRVDYINQFGPIDAWLTLATVTLTNTPQLYFDTSAWRQPQRLYRLVQVP